MQGVSLASWICASLMSVPTTFLKCSPRKCVPCPDPQPTSTASSAGIAFCREQWMRLSGQPPIPVLLPLPSPAPTQEQPWHGRTCRKPPLGPHLALSPADLPFPEAPTKATLPACKHCHPQLNTAWIFPTAWPYPTHLFLQVGEDGLLQLFAWRKPVFLVDGRMPSALEHLGGHAWLTRHLAGGSKPGMSHGTKRRPPP